MRTSHIAAAICILAATAATAGDIVVTAPKPIRGPTHDATTYAVAGIRLGMARADALAAAKGLGYARNPEYISFMPSYGETVAERIGEATHVYQGFQPGDVGADQLTSGTQTLLVSYAPARDGEVVSGVTWTKPGEGTDGADVASRLVSAYGQPTRSFASRPSMAWCADKACDSSDGHAPRLAFTWKGVWQVELDDGGRAGRAGVEAAEAEARRRVLDMQSQQTPGNVGS